MDTFFKQSEKVREKTRGFTLVETLLVISLMAMVSVSVFRVFLNGVRIWERSERFYVEEDLAIFLDMIGQDFRNSVDYSLFNFKGIGSKISFPSIIKVRADQKVSGDDVLYVDQLGMVEYYYDSLTKGIYKRKANYGQASKKRYGKERLLVKPVRSLRFLYYFFNEDGQRESKSFIDGESPDAIQIEVEIPESTGRYRKLKKLVLLPKAY